MKTCFKIPLLIALSSFNVVNTIGQTKKNSCKDSLSYNIVKSRWNKKVKTLKNGNWKLPNTISINLKQDSILLTQSLDGPSLYFIATILKGCCLKRVVIRAKRDSDIGYASLVAWLTVIKVFNPELSPEERKKVLDDLRITEQNSFFNSTTARGNNTYFFEETSVGNSFIVTTKN